MKSDRKLLASAAFAGALSVAVGAFGAHVVGGQAAEWLKTGGQYLMVHAALAAAVAMWSQSGRMGRFAAWLALSGGIVFCAALTVLALTDIRVMGAVAPIGGALMIAGWITLAVRAFRGHPAQI
ncbi:DUF423 domain-containing protein [uncultured Brevundimonas sp.]|uniref:DUF423 domain-containing protein n=1 Tax=uncultured Brevundimonas sp. TaxID=213418 RepID=UPI00261A55CE|nr:DUF423 domain-containing protein [uncultured Brevundimonas sp.]